MIGTSLRVEPAFEGEVSVSFYGKSSEALSRITQRRAYNGYSTNGKNFIKRCGFYACYRSNNRLFTFNIDEKRIGLIEDNGTNGVLFSVYSVESTFRIKDPVPNTTLFDQWTNFSELNFRSGSDIMFSVTAGLFTVNNNNELIEIFSTTDKSSRISHAFSPPYRYSFSEHIRYKLNSIGDKVFDGTYWSHGPYANFLYHGRLGYTETIAYDDVKFLANQGIQPFPSLLSRINIEFASLNSGNLPGVTRTLESAQVEATITYLGPHPGTNKNDLEQDATVVFKILSLSYTTQSTLPDIKDFSKVVFFNNRLLIFFANKIYYSSIDNPYNFAVTPVSDTGILTKTTGGVLDLLQFYNTSGGLTNVVSIGDYIVLTTNDTTYLIVNDANSPLGMKISIISNEGAIAGGLLVQGHELYKLSKYGLKKLMNYRNYATLQEIDTALYQPHIYTTPHIELSFSKKRSERYLYTLRQDGILFCHTTIPASIASEYAYYVVTSRFESEYFEVKQIAQHFKSGIAKFRRHWGDQDANILFIYDHFDFNNDNVLPYSVYQIGDLDNYLFLDMGNSDHTTLHKPSENTQFYTYDDNTKHLAVRLDDYILNLSFADNSGHHIINIGDLIRVNNEVDLPVISYVGSVLTLDLTQIAIDTKNINSVAFMDRVKANKPISVNGKIYGTMKTQIVDMLKNIYKQGEPITDELLKCYDGIDGKLTVSPFDLYGTKNPNPSSIVPYKPLQVDGCYFSVGLPFRSALDIHVDTLDVPSSGVYITARAVLTEHIDTECKINEYDTVSYSNSTNGKMKMHQISHRLDIPNGYDNLVDFSDLSFTSRYGHFMSILSFVIHL